MNPIRSLRNKSLLRGRSRPRSLFVVGVVFLACSALVVVLLANKPTIATMLRSGETIKAELNQNYQLYPDETKVKIAGLEVGVVSDVERTEAGTTLVSMKVDESAVDSLGSAPSAAVIPKTVLGGQYAIELKHGGGTGRFESGFIPKERTRVPIELDRILESLPQPTRQSLQHVVGGLDSTLADGGKDALRDLVANAPATLGPAGTVLQAAQGTRPGVDLPQLVTNLEATAGTLSSTDGQLSDIVTSLRKTTDVLAQQSQPLAAGIASLPETLRDTRSGVTDLRGTLGRLTETAGAVRPAARELDPLLQRLDPVLAKTRPLLSDLRPLMTDAEPTVRQLVPVAQGGTQLLEPLKGPVLDRVNGPIANVVLNTWHGSGPYKDSGGGIQADHKFYEELGYLVTNLDRASMTQDAQGSLLGFQVGASTSSIAGNPLTLTNLLEHLKQATGGAR